MTAFFCRLVTPLFFFCFFLLSSLLSSAHGSSIVLDVYYPEYNLDASAVSALSGNIWNVGFSSSPYHTESLEPRPRRGGFRLDQ